MKVAKEKCLELGVKYIETHNCYPAAKRWTVATAGCSRDRVYENWGSWGPFIDELKVLTAVPKIKQERVCKWNKQLCIESLHKSAKNNNGWPRYKDFNSSNEYPSISTIKEKFGSWGLACNAAGFVKEYSSSLVGKERDLLGALTICFDKFGYTMPKHHINKEQFLLFIANRTSTKISRLGMSTSQWSHFIADIFPDKPNNTNYYNWLLLKNNWLFCSKCEKVKNIDNFRKASRNTTGFQSTCKQCIKPTLATSQRSIQARYKASKIKATPAWANLGLIKEIYDNCPSGCHVDHIIPLQGKYICGLHVENNLQYLPSKDNVAKNNYHESEYWW